MFNNIRKSWQTTVAGILQFLSVLGAELYKLFDLMPETNPEWGLIVSSFIILVGLITARDNGVSSEEAGVKEAKTILPRSDLSER